MPRSTSRAWEPEELGWLHMKLSPQKVSDKDLLEQMHHELPLFEKRTSDSFQHGKRYVRGLMQRPSTPGLTALRESAAPTVMIPGVTSTGYTQEAAAAAVVTGGCGGGAGSGGGAPGHLESGGRGGGGRDGAKKTKAPFMHFGAVTVITMVAMASVLDKKDSEVYQNSENHDPNQAMELVDDLASLPTRRTNLTEKKKTPRSDDSFAFSTIAPPSKTNVKGKKTTPTSDDASTPPPLPPNHEQRPAETCAGHPAKRRKQKKKVESGMPAGISGRTRANRAIHAEEKQNQHISSRRKNVTLPRVYIKESRIKGKDGKSAGKGLFTTKKLEKGTWVTEYGIHTLHCHSHAVVY